MIQYKIKKNLNYQLNYILIYTKIQWKTIKISLKKYCNWKEINNKKKEKIQIKIKELLKPLNQL